MLRYQKPYYPKGTGFWTDNVVAVENQLMNMSLSVSVLADKYFDTTHIVSTVNETMEYFKTTEEIMDKIRNENDGEITFDDSYFWFWDAIGCRKDAEAVERFRSELASAMVNTIVNGMTYRLRLTSDEKTKKRLEEFVAAANGCFTIKWMNDAIE